MSGLSRTPGKRVGVNSPPRVRIPPLPPVFRNFNGPVWARFPWRLTTFGLLPLPATEARRDTRELTGVAQCRLFLLRSFALNIAGIKQKGPVNKDRALAS